MIKETGFLEAKEIELVVFDMAGTTIQDSGQVPEAFTTVFRVHGLELTPEALRAVRGASKREAIRLLVERQIPGDPTEIAKRTERIFSAFLEELGSRYKKEGVQAIPGAPETITWLKERGIQVALNTGFDRDTAGLILRLLGWEQNTVCPVVCGDDVKKGRPAPYLIFRAMEATGVLSVHRVMNVGDTILDLQAGQNAGVRINVGVLSGAHTREQLEPAPHTHLLSSVATLPTLWK